MTLLGPPIGVAVMHTNLGQSSAARLLQKQKVTSYKLRVTSYKLLGAEQRRPPHGRGADTGVVHLVHLQRCKLQVTSYRLHVAPHGHLVHLVKDQQRGLCAAGQRRRQLVALLACNL